MDDRVEYETRDDGRIALISMARERYRNALSEQMMAALEEAFSEAERDSGVRVIVLRGLGPTFSAGHDLVSPDSRESNSQREAESSGAEV
jgi:enoyl-CoA hydratase